jgi:RNA polymerase sigma-70 factor (ECF subfamily)
VWPHRATLLRVAKILVGRDADAQDLAQETLLRAYRGLQALRDDSDERAWLLTILRHARVDFLRTKDRAPDVVSLDAVGDQPSRGADEGPADAGFATWDKPEEILNGFSDQQVIEALQKLPEDIRLTLLLVDVEQLDHADAARILDVPVGTVKSRTHRGRGMLRAALLPVARDLGMVPR